MTGRQASLDLDPDPLAARQAREFVTTTINRWGVGRSVETAHVVDTAQLLTSELVTNGVLHARTCLGVCVKLGREDLTVEVHDNDPRLPVPRGQRVDLIADIDRVLERVVDVSPDVDERHTLMEVGPAGAIGAGRGLLLVDSLADEWGVLRQATGKSVWFRLSWS